MHVGMATLFQNPQNARTDCEVYQQELRLSDLVEPLGVRVDLGRGASLHRLHDVPGRTPVPHLYGRADRTCPTRVHGGGAAVA